MKRLLGALILLALVAASSALLVTAATAEWRDVDVQELITNAPGEEEFPNASAIFLNLQETASVADDGSVMTLRNRLIKVLTLRGREEYSNQTFLYNAETESLAMARGVTVRASGRSVEVEEDAINDVTPSFLEGATMYANVLNKVISFPVAGPGSVMELQLMEEQKPEPDLSYSGIEYLGAMDPILDGSFTITYPETWSAPVTMGYSGDLGMVTIEKTSSQGEIVFSVRDVPALVEEENMPPASELFPAVLYSSYDSWEEPSLFFADVFFPHVQTGGAIADRVAADTEGLTDREDKIRAIFLDVATNVRNVYLNLGLGGYEPNDAETVLANKYGDTRDKAVLLISMLRAAGFEAYPALVAGNTDARFTESVPTLKQFARILIDVPENGEHRFMDPFLDDASYGFLRWGRGNTALVIQDDGAGSLVQVPRFTPDENQASRTLNLALDAAGDASITASCALTGYFDRKTRMTLKDTKPSEEQKLFDSAASSISAAAVDGGYSPSDMADLTVPVTVTQKIEAPELAVAQGDMMIVHLPGFPFGFASTGVAPSLAERKYAFEFPCEFVSAYEINLKIPEGYEVVWAPENSVSGTDAVTFVLTCEVDPQAHAVSWRSTTTVKDRSIPADAYPDFKAAFDRSASPKNRLLILRKA